MHLSGHGHSQVSLVVYVSELVFSDARLQRRIITVPFLEEVTFCERVIHIKNFLKFGLL